MEGHPKKIYPENTDVTPRQLANHCTCFPDKSGLSLDLLT